MKGKKCTWLLIIFTVFLSLTLLVSGCGPDEVAPDVTDEPVDEEPVVVDDDEVFVWRLQSIGGDADLEYIGLEPFVEAVYERSGGRLIIETFPEGTVVPADEQLEAVEAGVIDISSSQGGYSRGTVPVGMVDVGLPGQYKGFGSLDEYRHLLYEFEDGALHKLLREAYADQGGVFYLGSHTHHGYPVFISKTPLRTMDDFQGLVVRAIGAWQDLIAEFGAATTFIPGSEMYMALSLGTIDVATWSVEGFLSYSWYEVAPYIMRPTISENSLSHFLINQDSWNALPDDIKQILEEAYHEVFTVAVFDLYEEEWQNVENLQEELGYEIIDMDESFLIEAHRIAREVQWPEVAEIDDYTREAVAIVERWHAEYGD